MSDYVLQPDGSVKRKVDDGYMSPTDRAAQLGISPGKSGSSKASSNKRTNVSASAPSPARTGLMDASKLASMYGNIDYNEDVIRSKFNKATADEFALKRKEYQQGANQFYNQVGATNLGVQDAMRKAKGAVSTGASRGVADAQALMATQGLQQESVLGATDLANKYLNLADAEGAAMSKNDLEAMTTANQLKMGLGNLSANLYGVDTQFDVGQMQYYAQLDAAKKALEGTVYNADQVLTGNKYVADQGLVGTKYNADTNRDVATQTNQTNYQIGDLNSYRNLLGTRETVQGNKDIAKMKNDSDLLIEGLREAGLTDRQAKQLAANFGLAKMNSGGGAGGTTPPIQTPEMVNFEYGQNMKDTAYQAGDYNGVFKAIKFINPQMKDNDIHDLIKSDTTFMNKIQKNNNNATTYVDPLTQRTVTQGYYNPLQGKYIQPDFVPTQQYQLTPAQEKALKDALKHTGWGG